MRILVVDDDAAVRESLGRALRLEGYEVELASDGRQALDRLGTEPLPAVLIVDLVMPLLSGWDLCAQMSRRPALARLPVLVLSASPTLEAPLPLPQALVLGKPIRFGRLLAELERHCR
jgi:CheY-like chemotaxis protein